jgi:hypothetical protein
VDINGSGSYPLAWFDIKGTELSASCEVRVMLMALGGLRERRRRPWVRD